MPSSRGPHDVHRVLAGARDSRPRRRFHCLFPILRSPSSSTAPGPVVRPCSVAAVTAGMIATTDVKYSSRSFRSSINSIGRIPDPPTLPTFASRPRSPCSARAKGRCAQGRASCHRSRAGEPDFPTPGVRHGGGAPRAGGRAPTRYTQVRRNSPAFVRRSPIARRRFAATVRLNPTTWS